MIKPHNFFAPVQRTLFIIVYILVCVLIFMAGWFLIGKIFPDFGGLYALYVILFLLFGAVLGAYLYVLISIPTSLVSAFDKIKNKIAGGEISSVSEFSKELASFLVNFFNFFGFDVVSALVKIQGEPPAVCNLENYEQLISIEEILKKSRNVEDVFSIGKVSFGTQRLNSYVVPIWFGKEWLGFFCVFTDSRLMPLFCNILNKFEDEFIDDQLMHVLHRFNIKCVQELCIQIEGFSQQIDTNKIQSATGYFKTLLPALLKASGCKAGFVRSVYSEEIVKMNVPGPLTEKIPVPENDKTISTGNNEYELAFIKLIKIDKLLAVIVLLDNSYTPVTKAKNLMENCLNVKIANQLMHLENKTGNRPKHQLI